MKHEPQKPVHPLFPDAPSLCWQAPPDMESRLIRSILKHELKCSGTVIRRMRQPGCVLVNGMPARVVDKMGPGSILEVCMPEPEDSTLIPENLPLAILWEDEHLLIVEKSDCMAVHPSAIHRSGTLANAVAFYLNDQKLHRRVRPVTRLDRNTSGLVLFAKTAYAQHELSGQAEKKIFHKRYLGICVGQWDLPVGAIGVLHSPIRRKPGSIIERETHPDGQPSVTHFKILAHLLLSDSPHVSPHDAHTPCTLLEYHLETGRTHQIRVHSADAGYPLLGDTLYGGSLWPGLSGQALHCDQLSFLHPITGEPMTISTTRSAPFYGLLENTTHT